MSKTGNKYRLTHEQKLLIGQKKHESILNKTKLQADNLLLEVLGRSALKKAPLYYRTYPGTVVHLCLTYYTEHV